MTTRRCWGRNIRGRWHRASFEPAHNAAAACGVQGTVERRSSTRRRCALATVAVVALAQQGPAPLTHPAIADYDAFTSAQELIAQKKFAEAASAARVTIAFTPVSPLRAEAVMLAARALLDGGPAREAALLLEKELARLREPEASHLLARAHEAAGETLSAARRFQRVYYEYPASPLADDAGAALARLNRSLGPDFPTAPTAQRLTRARRLIDAGRTTRAITELQEIASVTTGAEHDLARVRAGAARFAARLDASAFDYLKNLTTGGGEAEAERLYYLLASARRLGRAEAVREALDALAANHATSRWRLEALISAANQHLVEDRTAEYEPLYRACADNFGDDARAAWCHWRATWIAWRESRPDRGALLRDHVRRFPSAESVATAMYFLGRLAESERDFPAARAWYERIAARHAQYYYATLARERLKEPAVARAQAAEAVRSFLGSVAFPRATAPSTFVPDAATKLRLERARLLRAASREDWADNELRFAARTDAMPHVAGLALAQSAIARGEHRRALLGLRQAGLDYLSWPMESAPEAFWRAAFPLPYREAVETQAAANELDAFLVAGLIRQESAFDPRAISTAKAMGLMQIRPLTGRELSRKVGLRGFTTPMLYRPEVSVRLGAYHLRGLVEEFGKVEVALAGYNAGRSRALKWRPWIEHREPAEFIETIPFIETHGYVQAVLRNAAMYRRLYGGTLSAADERR